MRVLLAYDGSAGAEMARTVITNLSLPPGTEIRVCTVVQRAPELLSGSDMPSAERPPSGEDHAARTAGLQLAAVTSSLQTPSQTCDARVLRGHPASALLAEARAWNADLIVIGNRGHGALGAILLGSVSTEVVDHAPYPVLVARRPVTQRVVLGVDGSHSAHHAVATLVAWPMTGSMHVTVVGVSEPIPGWEVGLGGPFAPLVAEEAVGVEAHHDRVAHFAVDEALSELRRTPARVDGEVRQGDPASELIAAAGEHDADLIVLGTRGLGMLGRLLLGSVARKVLLHTNVSVLVVRPVRERVARTETARSLVTA